MAIMALPTIFINTSHCTKPHGMVPVAIRRPHTVTGYLSPYPTVVSSELLMMAMRMTSSDYCGRSDNSGRKSCEKR